MSNTRYVRYAQYIKYAQHVEKAQHVKYAEYNKKKLIGVQNRLPGFASTPPGTGCHKHIFVVVFSAISGFCPRSYHRSLQLEKPRGGLRARRSQSARARRRLARTVSRLRYDQMHEYQAIYHGKSAVHHKSFVREQCRGGARF